MSICEVLIIVSFIMVTIIAISQYIESNVPKLCNVLELMNVFPCYEVKVFKGGKRLRTTELIQHVNSPVKAHKLKNGTLYIEIY
mgnify:CR=1 FL=1|jgi:hypothetical protein|nr:MAG TPA: L,D-transpeptidase C-terminal domain [Caudoviricetes sp.]